MRYGVLKHSNQTATRAAVSSRSGQALRGSAMGVIYASAKGAGKNYFGLLDLLQVAADFWGKEINRDSTIYRSECFAVS